MGRQLASDTHERILIYGLGGGRGHAARTLGLADGFRRLGLSPRLILPKRLTFDTHAHGELGQEIHFVDRPASPAALWHVIETQVHRWRPRTFIVDTFPRGVLGEFDLDFLSQRVPQRILLTRYVRPHAQAFLRSVVATHYGWIVDLEPNLGWLGGFGSVTQKTSFGPVIASTGTSIRTRTRTDSHSHSHSMDEAACVDDTSDLIDVLMVSSLSDPILDRFLRRLAARFVRLGFKAACDMPDERSSPRRAPVQRARVVVGAAGYNLTYECAHAETWHVSIPRPRTWDDQDLRARNVARISTSPQALEEEVRGLIECATRREHRFPVHSAAELAKHLWAGISG
ncbi:MAG: hypothetical protein IPK13_09675 [Deltaproteobacteria bacterium]|nr:hypothetical protein [Deltaproteobacteria bacterium]